MRGKTYEKIIILAIIFCICFSFVGCASEEQVLNSNIVELETRVSELESEISQLEAERDTLTNEITDIKIENSTAKYVITFNIRQQHYSLDVTDYLKDSMNDISISIPVDKEYYDSVEVGDTIADDFRVGSAIFKGSFGSWNITVEDKTIQ